MATLSSSTFALPLHCLSIGDAILIYWDGDRKWYPAEIIGAEGDHRCEVLYEDGEQEWVSLDKVRFIVKRSERSSRPSKINAVGAEDGGGIKKVKNILFGIGEVPVIACRRSSRLKKDEILNLKSSSGVEEDLDAQCLAVPSTSCSEEGKQHDLTPQHANKPTKRKSDDRARRSWGSRSGNLTQPKKKESCNFNSNVDTGYIEEAFDERSSGYPTTSCTFEGPDGLRCSICQTGICSNFLVQCKNSGCFCVFHTFCLHPPLQKIDEEWVCPYCEGDSLASKLAKGRQVIAKKIQRIVGHKQVIFEDLKSVVRDEFLVKWDSLSHQNDSWVPREWLYVTDRVRLHNYLKKCPILGGSDSVDEREPEWFKIDRVIACRRKHNPDEPCEIWKVCPTHQVTGEFEFLVKWKGLDYCESTWESTCTEELLAEVGRLVQRHQRAAERTENVCVSSDSESPIKTPSNLYGAILYDYQIQGLNWILSNFKANKNVILADEMGLGKTVQVVSFVSCMKQEKLTHNPVLVIAPKSILFQWEKVSEFFSFVYIFLLIFFFSFFKFLQMTLVCSCFCKLQVVTPQNH